MPQWSGSPFGYAGANPSSNVDPTGRRAVGTNGCETGNSACDAVHNNGQEFFGTLIPGVGYGTPVPAPLSCYDLPGGCTPYRLR